MDETALYERVMREAGRQARKLHPELGTYQYKTHRTMARRIRTSYLRLYNVLLGYGELVAEIADGDEQNKAIRWKFGDGVHTWDELPDIPGPEYAFIHSTTAAFLPRNPKKPRIKTHKFIKKRGRQRND